MKKLKYYTLFIFLSLLCLDNVSATCTNQDKEYFKSIEDEYKITYEFDSNSKKYQVTFYGTETSKYDYVVYSSNDLKCARIDEKTSRCTNFEPGKYIVGIKGKTKSCDEALKKITLELAKYNKYSEDSLCKGIEEFVLCQQTYDKDIDYETFKSRVATYKKTKEKNEIKQEEEKKNQKVENEKINNIKKYIEENLMYIIIITIFVILVIITIIITVKQQRKSRRLE